MTNGTIKNVIKELQFLVIIIYACFLACTEGFGAGGQKTWIYEIKSVESKSSNPDLFTSSLKVERVSRGVYAISGDVLINFDIVEGDDNQVGAKSFRSAKGDGDYASLPFQMSPSHWHKVLNSYYKDVIMGTLKDCSDMPVFENEFEPPLEKKTYTLTRCQFSQDGLPNHLQDGFYKLVIYGTGTVSWEIEVVAEVTPSM